MVWEPHGKELALPVVSPALPRASLGGRSSASDAWPVAKLQKFFSQTARLRMHPSMSKTHVRTKQPNQNTNQCTWGSGEPKGLAPRQTSKSWLSGSFPKAVMPLSALLKQTHQTPSSVTSPQHAMLFQLLMYTSQICAYVRLCWREHSWHVQSNTKQTTA